MTTTIRQRINQLRGFSKAVLIISFIMVSLMLLMAPVLRLSSFELPPYHSATVIRVFDADGPSKFNRMIEYQDSSGVLRPANCPNDFHPNPGGRTLIVQLRDAPDGVSVGTSVHSFEYRLLDLVALACLAVLVYMWIFLFSSFRSQA